MADTSTTGRGGQLRGLVPMIVIGVVVVLLLRSCLDDLSLFDSSDDTASDPGIATTADTDEPATADGPVDADDPDTAALLDPRDPECPDEDGTSERHLQWTEPPPMCIDPDSDYTATLETSRGDIHIDLDTTNAPETVNNFIFLARWHYYDNVDFHIVFPGDSIQAGDPVGDPPGTGGPGYSFDDEYLPEDEDPPYPTYSVSMGNAGPDTNADVFFILSGTEAESLPVFSRFGQVTDEASQTVVDAIDATGVPRAGHDGTPREPTTIHTVTITQDR